MTCIVQLAFKLQNNRNAAKMKTNN